ncbi:MAG: hypothetical protein ACLQVY_05865 [Limisphaerales bacterium]
MGATVYWYRTLGFDVFNVNAPLTRIVVALPVRMCNPRCDFGCYSSRPQDRSEWAIGSAFIAANSSEKVRWCFTLGRWSLIPLLLVGGYFGHRLAKGMYGWAGGFVFLALWCFSPSVLAWGATICPDAVAAALGLVAVYTFRQWLLKPTWVWSMIAGISLGLLPLAKPTWMVAFALWPLIWSLWTLPIWLTRLELRSLALPPFRQLAAVLVLGLYVLNLGYLFDGTSRPLGQYVFISHLFRGPEVPENQRSAVLQNRFTGTLSGAIPVPLPAEFVQGIDTQRYDFERGLPSYLRGEHADHGWWYYYLYALAIKEPLGTWCLAALAVGVSASDIRRTHQAVPAGPASAPTPLPKGEGRLFSASWRDEMVVLVPLLAILVFVSSQTGFSVHSRYVLPALPFLFVWISKIGRVFEMGRFSRRRLAIAAILIVALAWSVGSSLSIYPHSLSYFNELAAVLPTPADTSYPTPNCGDETNRGILSWIKDALTAGPRNGPRHLLDSNMDSGQDFFYLEDWCEAHPEARPMKLAYLGAYPLERSRIKSAGAPPFALDNAHGAENPNPASFGALPGWYALSVNEIYDRSQRYRYFLNFQPVAMAGYSIYIYHITLADANRERRQMGLPELTEK